MKKNSLFFSAVIILAAACVIIFYPKGSTPLEAQMNDKHPKVEDKKIILFNVAEKKLEEVSTVVKTEQQWQEQLSPLQYKVTRKEGTEHAFSGELLKNKKNGVYQCVCCGTDLFLSDHKFESGTGWPSFWQPIHESNIGFKEDNKFFMKRTEVHCPRCGCHLGHVFDDGPQPTGKRFCINSAALTFKEMD